MTKPIHQRLWENKEFLLALRFGVKKLKVCLNPEQLGPTFTFTSVKESQATDVDAGDQVTDEGGGLVLGNQVPH